MKKTEIQSEYRNIDIDDTHLNFGLTVNSVGYKTILPEERILNENVINNYKFQFKKGRINAEFKLVYVTSGSVIVHFEGLNEIEIKKGQILMIMPNQKYQYYHLNDTEWKEHFIRFEANPAYNKFIKSFFLNENQVLDTGFNEELVKLFQRSIDVVRNGLKSSQVYLSGMLLHILGLIISESKNNAIAKKELQLVEQAKIIMNENVFEEIHLQEIASRLNISYTSFRKKFKEHVGLAPAKYFSELRLLKSKELLTETSYSIKEISFMLQFFSIEHFAKIFKKATGFTPKEYRMSDFKKNS